MWENRFYAYERGWIDPKRIIDSHYVESIAVGFDGRIYLATWGTAIHMWCGKHRAQLKEHEAPVKSIAVGKRGQIYSGSVDGKICGWDGTDGKQFQDQHTAAIMALLVGLDDCIYSGSMDSSIRVWSPDGKHLDTLEGHTDGISVLALGLNGNIFSGSFDTTIRIWSNRKHVQTIEDHLGFIYALAIGKDGKIYSGSSEETSIRVRDCDGTPLRDLEAGGIVRALAVGLGGKIFSASGNLISVWSGKDGTHLHSLSKHQHNIKSIVVGNDGRIYSGSWDGVVCIW